MVTKVLYLATTFPRFSETFLQREVQFLLDQPEIDLDVRSLWGGPGIFETSSGTQKIKTDTIRSLPSALSRIPFWIFKSPKPFQKTLGFLLNRKAPMNHNWLENNWGFAWAMKYATEINRSANRPDLIHATWGTMPAAAAYALHHFTGIPYSMEAHAYDVYKHGGDWFLKEKADLARFVRSSTIATQQDLLQRHQPDNSEKYCLIRRGIQLPQKPPLLRKIQSPIGLISVGRLVEKKNLTLLIQIFLDLANRNVPFSADIIGTGPKEDSLRNEVQRTGLDKHVTFHGRRDYHYVANAYQNADALLFTGKPSNNGDRDGLPNVIAEAMSIGLPVLTTPILGALEAIEHEKTGFVLPFDQTAGWCETIQSLAEHPNLQNIRQNALEWIHQNFSIEINGAQLLQRLLKASGDRTA